MNPDRRFSAADGPFAKVCGMDVIADFRMSVISALAKCGAMEPGSDDPAVTLERPKFAAHGELATNAAIVRAKRMRMPPRELALRLAGELEDDGRVKSVGIAGPGFLNFVLKPDVWVENLRNAIQSGCRCGSSDRGRGKRVNLEFVSANPTGPLHVGHARGAIFGDSLGRLLEFTGYQVTREYYLNDGGAQVDVLARSAYLRYLEANGAEIEISEGHYRGAYLKEVGSALAAKFGRRFVGKPEDEWLEEFRKFAIDAMVARIHEDLALLGVRMDRFFSEASLYGSGRIEQAIDELHQRGLIYEGRLPPPKGGNLEGWEPRDQTLFRSTAHGDDVDRPIRKSDGSWTYFAPDIAYHHDKIQRGYDELINVFGADHSGYTKRIKAVVSALSDGKTPIDVRLTQLVRVIKEGGAQKMSKRAGEFVQLREAVNAVGPDVARFVMLMRRNDAQLDFDFEKVQEQSKDNPVFYVQYCHARICSALSNADEQGFPSSDESLAAANLSRIQHDAQISLARRIAEWPRVVDLASSHHEPHRIAFFLNELASEFHALWTLGNREPHLRIIQQEDQEGTVARMALARAAAVVISAGLNILGVKPMTEMRD